ncbi:MAG TPA: Fe-S-cluster-containing hydrogenase [Polyangia bacterium]
MDELVQIRSRSRQRAWRGLSELIAAHEDRPEFPPGADEPPGALSRRMFLKLLGATAALTGLDGCQRNLPSKILPYSAQPPEVIPGVATYYATSMVLDGYATGLLVESHEGRPTKIEGNPDHPASLGASGLYEQASVLQLYDPERARRLLFHGNATTWESVLQHLRAPRTDNGAGLRLLLEPTSSPLVHAQIARVRARYPEARVCFYAPGAYGDGVLGANVAFGRPLQPQYDFSRAEVIVSLDADFLGSMPFRLRYAHDFAARRRIAKPGDAMNRLYVIESLPSVTGGMADHRRRRRSSEVADLAGAIASRLSKLPAGVRDVVAPLDGDDKEWAATVARDLERRPPGSTIVIAGDRQPPELRAITLAMNEALGNLGKTVRLTEPVLPLATGEDYLEDLTTLTGEMRAGKVDTLYILEGDPVYNAPADLDFVGALSHVTDSLHLGLYEDATSGNCAWFAPGAHYLESWGDGLAYDGTRSLIQPLIRPIFEGRSVAEILATVAGDLAPDGHQLLIDGWKKEGGDQLSFDRALKRGVVPDSAAKEVTAAVDAARVAAAAKTMARPTRPIHGIELGFYRSPTVHDGRFTNNPWLLEQPHPITKLTWDNAALMSPATAKQLGVADEQLVEVAWQGRKLRLPVLVVPGHADQAVSLELGYGQRAEDTFRDAVGVDVYPLRTSKSMAIAEGASVTRVHGRYELARTQLHWHMGEAPIAIRSTLAEYRRDPGFTAEEKGPVASLMTPVPYTGLQWAMSIDLSICTGCSACELACQAENNVLVVGKEGVTKSREMHWLRIDSYYSGPPESPKVVHQPMLCQHCEMAPCEYVCPVNATVHSEDGLNEMVYNRCVGTRFCSNNCPYKVRRFNWFNWTGREAYNEGMLQLQHNPDVTVRDRGVMEKCSYCVQRIRRVEIDATLENRQVRPGEVVTACQQACPTGAIQFGSLSHKDTEMVRRRNEPRSYQVLHDTGTKPRTMYLARIDNPNPELAGEHE